MGAGEREVLLHRHLGVRLADEAFGPWRSFGARGARWQRQGTEGDSRLAPQIVGNGEKSSSKPLYLVLQLLQAACRVFASANDHPAQRGQGGAQLTVRQVGHRRLGLEDRFRRRRRGRRGFARHAGLGEFQ